MINHDGKVTGSGAETFGYSGTGTGDDEVADGHVA